MPVAHPILDDRGEIARSEANRYDDLALVPEDVFEKAWKIVLECGEQERHFNQLQSTYRSLCSTWLLGVFAGIGFILSAERLPGVESFRALMVCGIALAGTVGIILLWTLDLLVYHKLLDAFFSEALKVERAFLFLPPFRSNMLRAHQNKGVLPKVVWFYAGSSTVTAILSVLGLVVWLHAISVSYAILGGVLLSVGYGFAIFLMVRKALPNPFGRNQ